MRGKLFVHVFTYLVAIAFTALLLYFAVLAYIYDGPVRMWFDKYHENVPEIMLLTTMLVVMLVYLPSFLKEAKR